jgi:hypothetical protein
MKPRSIGQVGSRGARARLRAEGLLFVKRNPSRSSNTSSPRYNSAENTRRATRGSRRRHCSAEEVRIVQEGDVGFQKWQKESISSYGLNDILIGRPAAQGRLINAAAIVGRSLSNLIPRQECSSRPMFQPVDYPHGGDQAPPAPKGT